MPLALAIHGGAWNIPDDEVEAHADGIARVLHEAWAALSRGASALDVVELAVRALENDETFNAGRGSHLNRAGRVEMDASIMEGTRRRAGAVAAVGGLRHPVSLARAVMERTPHVLIVGHGARRLAREVGAERCRTIDLLVGRERERYRRVRSGDRTLVEREFRRGRAARAMDTVGAAAVDGRGRCAAATSTGGTQDKAPGRVGDSAVIGAGTYADDAVGACSCTGLGEAIVRAVLAKSVLDLVGAGRAPERAATLGARSLRRVGGTGGLVLVTPDGRAAAGFSTPRMARGLATTREGLRVGVGRSVRRP